MTRRAARTDANHGTIRDQLRELGFYVLDVHDRWGMLDLMVRSRNGCLCWLEIKAGPDEPLTLAEAKVFEMFPRNTYRVDTLEQALEALNEMDGG